MSDSNGPNISGMVNDQQFLGLSPADKRMALYQLTGDDTFRNLNDGQTMQFVSRAVSQRTGLTRPDIVQPPSVQRPQVKMQESMLAPSQAAMQPDPQLISLSQSGEGYASDEGTAQAMTTAGVGTLATLIGARGVQAMAGTAMGRAILAQTAKGAAHAIGAGTVYGIGKKLGWWGGKNDGQ
jgi:hypothetical protein